MSSQRHYHEYFEMGKGFSVTYSGWFSSILILNLCVHGILTLSVDLVETKVSSPALLLPPNPNEINCTVIAPKPLMHTPSEFLKLRKHEKVNRSTLRTAFKDLLKSMVSAQDPNVYRTTPEVIQHDGYPFEIHEFTTDDGYILNYYRIPHGIGGNGSSTTERRRPVLFHHGITIGSGSWIATARNDNMPYILADAGYDVWLSNSRGTKPSRGHTNKSISWKEYWDFTHEDIGVHDLPAAFDYILRKTGFKKLYYVGHSMGTTVVFSGCSLKPEVCDKIHLFIALSPSAFQYRSYSVARLLAPSELRLQHAVKNPFLKKLIPGPFPNDVILWLLRTGKICNPTISLLCGSAAFLVGGHDYINTNFTVLPLWLARAFDLASAKVLRHYSQNMLRDEFSRFDYGAVENCKRYKQTVPPEYNIGDIRVKTILMYGATDTMSSEEDNLELASKLTLANVTVHKIPLYPFNHMDYMIAKNARKYTGDPIVEYMKQYPMET